MISIGSLFFVFILFFAIIGALRGWSQEIIVTAGLILFLFIVKMFGSAGLDALNMAYNAEAAMNRVDVHKSAFWLLCSVYAILVFFSYQGPGFTSGFGGRLKESKAFQSYLLGFIFGGLNGYLFFGTVICFLEYFATPAGFQRLGVNEGYPFSLQTVARPAESAMPFLMDYLPFELMFVFNGLLLPLLVVVFFLFVIVALI